MNLFLRFFLFLWLTTSLLAASFFTLGRLSGSEAIKHALDLLNAQAETVSGLLRQDGRRAARHWIQQQPAINRPHLLNQEGRNPFSRRRHGPPRPFLNLDLPLRAGIQQHASGLASLVARLPDIDPPLFLVQQVAPRQINRMPIWTLLLAALLIISTISYLLANVLSRRILLLRHAAQGIADGNLDTRVAVTGKDEVGQLANEFNRMADHVEVMLQSQRQLVRDVSHELRSPLARLRIALELAQRSSSDRQALTRIEKETDELETLVTSLLSLARIESGQSSLEKQPINIDAIIRAIVHDANFEGARMQVEVVISRCDDMSLLADPVLLRSAIENVIRNAIRYSPKNSRVSVNASQCPDTYMVTVEDAGPGVPDEALGKLFHPFSRVAAARDRNTGGFGLGLAISAKALKIHGGSIKAENMADGGLRVIMTIPYPKLT